MKDKKTNKPELNFEFSREDKSTQEGYPLYPADEDIYSRNIEEEDIDPEDVTALKQSNEREIGSARNEKDFSDDRSGEDLDVPGSELDDAQEDIGMEDEENNYYSLGGDNHSDLEEDNG